jgi:hypothetical protein
MEERQQLPAVGSLERVTKQLSEETKAEARGMLMLCARDGACMLLLCARDGACAWGTQRSSRLTWTLPKFTRGVTEAATTAPDTARATSAPHALDKGVVAPVTARGVAPGTAPGGFGAVVGRLLSVVPVRRATSKRRRAALSVPWRAQNGAWRACPPCVLLLLTPALLT